MRASACSCVGMERLGSFLVDSIADSIKHTDKTGCCLVEVGIGLNIAGRLVQKNWPLLMPTAPLDVIPMAGTLFHLHRLLAPMSWCCQWQACISDNIEFVSRIGVGELAEQCIFHQESDSVRGTDEARQMVWSLCFLLLWVFWDCRSGDRKVVHSFFVGRGPAYSEPRRWDLLSCSSAPA